MDIESQIDAASRIMQAANEAIALVDRTNGNGKADGITVHDVNAILFPASINSGTHNISITGIRMKDADTVMIDLTLFPMWEDVEIEDGVMVAVNAKTFATLMED